LKEDALYCTLWRTRFGRGYGPVVRQTIERVLLGSIGIPSPWSSWPGKRTEGMLSTGMLEGRTWRHAAERACRGELVSSDTRLPAANRNKTSQQLLYFNVTKKK
jgi:hypothetical protein